jgi:competence protein ComEA
MESIPLPRVSLRRAAALVALVAVAIGVGAHRLEGRSPHEALKVAPVRASTRPSPAGPGGAAARLAVVDVEGAVRRPGLVRLAPGARVADAVARAGGFAPKADRTGVNLAATVADGQQVLVPRAGAGGGAAAGLAGAGGASSAPISLSSASAEQLDTLPGVGPVTAQKIVAYREQHGPFHSVDDLDAIPGIGPARLADLRGLVTP